MRCLVCSRPLPALAVEHGDEFCTSTCARAYHGCPLPVLKGRSFDDACGGCSGSLDARTAGCDACTRRHRQRAAALAEVASAVPDEAAQPAASPSLARTQEEAA